MMGLWRAPLFSLCFGLSGLCFGVDLSAKSALVLDERTGIVLFEKDADAIRYPASTTKIVTAMVMLETVRMDDTIMAPESAPSIEGSSLHLRPYEQIKARDLLAGIMLRSGNDACHTLAVHVSGDDAEFAKLMNEWARKTGCARTHFVTPHGLHDDRHYTTAHDLGLIARAAMQDPEFRDLAARRRATINRSINTKDTLIISKNEFLDKDKSYDGIKTGFTRNAGECFVGSATRNGYRFITVLLKSDDWKSDQKKLMNWAFKTFKRSAVKKKDEVVGELEVAGSRVPAKLSEDLLYAHKVAQEPYLSVVFQPLPNLKLPVSIGDPIGDAIFSDAKGWSKSVPVIAADTIQAPLAAGSANYSAVTFVILNSLFGAYVLTRQHSRRLHRATIPTR